MAWQMRITELVGQMQDAEGKTIDLTERGRWHIRVEFFDSENPEDVVRYGFEKRLPDWTWKKTLNDIKETGRVMRDARQLVAEHERNVGEVLPLD